MSRLPRAAVATAAVLLTACASPKPSESTETDTPGSSSSAETSTTDPGESSTGGPVGSSEASSTGGGTSLPTFDIVPNDDGILPTFDRKIVVFGVDIYAVPSVADAKLVHAANVMAQYLDNDEDGTVDNPTVHAAMLDAGAFMVMWASESDLEGAEPPPGREGQDLGDDETNPDYVRDGLQGRFDASLEEVLHIITHAGYARAYPEVFGEDAGSSIADAMDIARGGHFQTIPDPYPKGAWYTYDDVTCDYACMVTEYHYWALTSRLGAQANRLPEIGNEWRLETPAKLARTDTAVEALLADPRYAFPTVLPDGRYGD